ncbi:MAG: DJ-1/PfpI family protein [Mycobacterium sp.]
MNFGARRTVVVVLFDGVQPLDVTGPYDVFTSANRPELAAGAYTVLTASVGGRPVRAGGGLQLGADVDLATLGPVDTLVVPGGPGAESPDPLVVEAIRAAAPRASRVVSVCTGAFVLAAAGLLDGREATTHWAFCDKLAAEYPAVKVRPEPVFLLSGQVATSAGVTAGIDLALALVEDDLGRDIALAIARLLVVFLRRPSGQPQLSAQLAAQSAVRAPLRELQTWVSDHLSGDLSVGGLAARVQMSPRHFTRVFTSETGTSPGQYVDRVRLEAACRALEDGEDAAARVARDCGYGTSEAMRRAFVRHLAMTPSEYRHAMGRQPRPSSRAGLAERP